MIKQVYSTAISILMTWSQHYIVFADRNFNICSVKGNSSNNLTLSIISQIFSAQFYFSEKNGKYISYRNGHYILILIPAGTAITHFMMVMELVNLHNLTLNILPGCQDLNKQEMWSKKLSEFHRKYKI